MNTFAVSARDIQRSYRDVVDRVRQTKQPAILMSKKEPQAAIVSIEDLKEIEDMRKRNSAKALLKLAREVHELLKDEKLPRDLSSRHDHYLWEED